MQDEASELGLGSASTEHLLIWMLIGTIAHKPLVERGARDRAAACAITLAQRNVRVDIEEQPGTTRNELVLVALCPTVPQERQLNKFAKRRPKLLHICPRLLLDTLRAKSNTLGKGLAAILT